MIRLPPIEERFIARPGNYHGKTSHFIPDLSYDEFWEDFYTRFSHLDGLQFPIKKGNTTPDPYFGYFGPRWHPVTHAPAYFHIGVDIPNKAGTSVYPALPGIFEYSGFNAINGKYVLISHPDIVTDDGFTLFSIYMHLATYTIRFTQYQKMLREISFHTYPALPVKSTRRIGTVGTTGDLRGMAPHLHLQMELRRKDIIVTLDCMSAFGKPTQQNLSAPVKTGQEFKALVKKNSKAMSEWRSAWGEDYFR